MMNDRNIERALKMPCGNCHQMANEKVNLKGQSVELDCGKAVLVRDDLYYVCCRTCGTEPVVSGKVGAKEEFIAGQVRKVP